MATFQNWLSFQWQRGWCHVLGAHESLWGKPPSISFRSISGQNLCHQSNDRIFLCYHFFQIDIMQVQQWRAVRSTLHCNSWPGQHWEESRSWNTDKVITIFLRCSQYSFIAHNIFGTTNISGTPNMCGLWSTDKGSLKKTNCFGNLFGKWRMPPLLPFGNFGPISHFLALSIWLRMETRVLGIWGDPPPPPNPLKLMNSQKNPVFLRLL